MTRVPLSITLLAMLLMVGCAAGPPPPPVAQKWQNSQEKARQHWQACQLSPALAEMQHALYLAELRDDRPAMAVALQDLATLHMALGDLEVAAERFRQADGQFGQLGDRSSQQQVTVSLSMIQILRGHLSAGAEELEKILAQDSLPPPLRVTIFNGLAMAHRGLGHHEQALDYLAQAAAIAVAKQELATTLMNRAHVFFDQGELAVAGENVGQALALDRDLENLPGIAADLVMLAAIAEQQGRLIEAQDHLWQAGNIFDHCGIAKEREASRSQAKRLAARIKKLSP